MRTPQEARVAALDVRAFYKIAELARVGGVSTYRLLRLLRRSDVGFLRVGRAYLVSMAEVRRKIPPLWESLRLAEEVRAPTAERGNAMTVSEGVATQKHRHHQ